MTIWVKNSRTDLRFLDSSVWLEIKFLFGLSCAMFNEIEMIRHLLTVGVKEKVMLSVTKELCPFLG